MRIIVVLLALAACGSSSSADKTDKTDDGKVYETPAQGPKGVMHALVSAIEKGDGDAMWTLVSEKSFTNGPVGLAMNMMKDMPDKAGQAAKALGVSVEEFKSSKPIDLVRKIWVPKFMAMKGKLTHEDVDRLSVVTVDATHAKIKNAFAKTINFVKEDGVWKWDISEPLK